MLFCVVVVKAQSIKSIQNGRWVGQLKLTESDNLYFEFTVEHTNQSVQFTVLNGTERVAMNKPVIVNDSVHVSFKNFNSEFVFKLHSKTQLSGRWINHLKSNYSILFVAKASNAPIFPVQLNTQTSNFSGKWSVVFSPIKNDYAAIGLFDQRDHHLTGTFMTETGDFRFLSGNVSDNQMYLSGFDGSHTFLFTGQLDAEGKIIGTFLSGNHYKTDWYAKRNDRAELTHSDSITKVVGDPYSYALNLHDLDGNPYSFPNEQFHNKVVIVQVLGTWCANCMDETVYIKELYDIYHDQGLEVISVGYEIGNRLEDQAKQLKSYQQRFDLQHTIVVGGSASKSSAKEDFYFLSDITSFPTMLFIDRSGKIVRIHTGFSGPGTGNYYLDFKKKTDAFIQQLLKE